MNIQIMYKEVAYLENPRLTCEYKSTPLTLPLSEKMQRESNVVFQDLHLENKTMNTSVLKVHTAAKVEDQYFSSDAN